MSKPVAMVVAAVAAALFAAMLAGCSGPSGPPPATAPAPAPAGIDDHGDDAGSATAIRLGEPVAGVINREHDVDFFRFTAEAGRSYGIEETSGSLHEWHWDLIMMDSTGAQFQHGSDFWVWNSPDGQTVTWDAPGSGDYYVGITGRDTAAYTLVVQKIDH